MHLFVFIYVCKNDVVWSMVMDVFCVTHVKNIISFGSDVLYVFLFCYILCT